MTVEKAASWSVWLIIGFRSEFGRVRALLAGVEDWVEYETGMDGTGGSVVVVVELLEER